MQEEETILEPAAIAPEVPSPMPIPIAPRDAALRTKRAKVPSVAGKRPAPPKVRVQKPRVLPRSIQADFHIDGKEGAPGRNGASKNGAPHQPQMKPEEMVPALIRPQVGIPPSLMADFVAGKAKVTMPSWLLLTIGFLAIGYAVEVACGVLKTYFPELPPAVEYSSQVVQMVTVVLAFLAMLIGLYRTFEGKVEKNVEKGLRQKIVREMAAAGHPAR